MNVLSHQATTYQEEIDGVVFRTNQKPNKRVLLNLIRVEQDGK